MHRTDPSLPSSQPSARSKLEIQSAFCSTTSHETTCALFGPLHYEPGYAYPLIVWLHGQGSDERQLLRIMPLVSMRNYVAVAPRGVSLSDSPSDAEEPDASGYGWQQSDEVIEQARQRVFDGIAVARRKFHMARRRIFLAGFDGGGTMAFRLAMNHPQHFAGVLSFCGAFPSDRSPLEHLVDARQLAMFLAVGRDSREYPSAEVCRNLRLFHAAGLSITLRQYPCGHELAPQMLADMDHWILEQFAAAETIARESDG